MSDPHIILTNDDGIEADGLRRLWNAIKELGECTIVAPSEEKSASSMSYNFANPIEYHSIQWADGIEAWKVFGTPVDCVHLALKAIVVKPPTLIISGINHGSNPGQGILFSGTVGAAIAGSIYGVPSLAFSLVSNELAPDAQHYIKTLTEHFIKLPPSSGTCINVNIPSPPVKGLRFARQGKGFWTGDLKVISHSHERFSATFSNNRISDHIEHPESDISLLSQGYVTITPIQTHNLTDNESMEKHQIYFDSLIANLSTSKL